ncbi:hypothetical protein QR680_003575 [Steinernema hermaphroditum]|uniref:Uncharacterized protein n=1 Tax=Steinernema hermaphroditum TaxID=289476 RepID=A0AA39HLV5_9BILA|nr:hypothetical protein QR680_003575 [Steinernema hermaphroditum]
MALNSCIIIERGQRRTLRLFYPRVELFNSPEVYAKFSG